MCAPPPEPGVCFGDSIFLFSQVFNNPVSYNWQGPDSFTSTQSDTFIAIANHQAEGIYVLTIEDINGCK